VARGASQHFPSRVDVPLATLPLRQGPKPRFAVQTLVDYRKAGVGPDYTVVGRAILYGQTNLQKWLEAGGTRAAAASGIIPDPTVRARRQAKPRAAAEGVSR
jgi:hypothetical protein